MSKIKIKSKKEIITSLNRVEVKILKGVKKYYQQPRLAKGDSEADLIINEVSGKELTVSLVEGRKRGFLYGFGEIGRALGYSHGDEGVAGSFDFDYMPEEAFQKTKTACTRVSQKTINSMMNGDKTKFAKRNIRNLIKKAVQEGQPTDLLGKDIAKFFKETKFWKAAEIARTEVPLAYNLGRIEAAKTDGLKKARIELGARPCRWCIDNHSAVRTLAQAEQYMNNHHPNNDCVVVPLIDFSYYGIKPPEGYEPGDVGPVAKPRVRKPKVVKPKIPAVKKPTISPLIIVEDIKTVDKLPIESVVNRANRLMNEVKVESKIIAPKKLTDKFNTEIYKKYRISFEKETYDQIKAQNMINTVEKIHKNIKSDIIHRLIDSHCHIQLKIKPSKFNIKGWKYTYGTYDPKILEVKLRDSLKIATKEYKKLGIQEFKFGWTSTHEYGHHIWVKGLDDKMKKSFIKEVWSGETTKITSYAKTNYKECFSDSLAAFEKSPSVFKKKCPIAFRWFKTKLFGG